MFSDFALVVNQFRIRNSDFRMDSTSLKGSLTTILGDLLLQVDQERLLSTSEDLQLTAFG